MSDATPVELSEIVRWLADVTAYYRDPRTGDLWQLLFIVEEVYRRHGTDYCVLLWCADHDAFVVGMLSDRATVHIAPPGDY